MSEESKHTPGPWAWTHDAEPYSDQWTLSPGVLMADGSDGTPGGDDIDRANARLLAAAPDHALICWAVCVGSGRWEPWGDGRGEFCVNGMRYATKLDEFGCPIVNALIRAAITKAEG